MQFRTTLLFLVLLSATGADAQTNSPVQTAPPEHKEVVVVTGSWEPVALEESDRSVNNYPVRDASLLLFGNLGDVFAQDSSVYIQSRGAGGTQQDFSIRGASFEQTLVLINGIRVNDEQSAHYNSDFAVPMDAVDHVEILRGSGSTLYGSDATGGVINILTRPAAQDADPFEMRLRADGGNFATMEQSGCVAILLGPISQRIAFEREQSDGFKDDREYRNLEFSSDFWLHSSIGLTREFLGLEDKPFGADQFYGRFNSWERTKAWLATLSQDIGKRMIVTIGYRRHTDLFELLRDNPGFYTNRHVDEAWDGAFRRNDTVAKWARAYYGVEVTADSVHSNNLGLHARKQGAIYGAIDARSLRRASLSIGAREEFYAGGHIFVPNASGGYWLSRRVKLRGSASKAFRLPNYTDLYYSDPANRGNPNLEPERAANYEGGIDWHPTEQLKASATFFARRERDGIDYVRSDAAQTWQATNFDRVNFTGAEADVALSLPYRLTLQVGYTALHGAQSALGIYQSKYVFNYPTQQLVVSWERMSSAGWIARFRTGVTKQYERSTYVLVDASAGWTRSRFHPYARLTNIANADYQPVLGVTMAGRAVVGGLEIRVFGSGQ